MKIIKSMEEIPHCALALGNFDGLHIAHIEIINSCIEYAKKNGLKSGVLIFENHTETVLKKSEIKLLTTYEEKIKIIEKTGVDFVFVKRFDEDVMKMKPLEFFAFLTDDLKAKALFAGFDYHFGFRASGDAKQLFKMGSENNIFVSICNEIDIENEPISSTRIRELIKNGDVKNAKRYLNHAYTVSGKVVSGKQNGRKMGLPTANVEYNKEKLLPADGVYMGFTRIDDKEYKSLINVGKNPTFDAGKRTVEAHIIGYEGDLYDEYITVGFLEKIRDEKKFCSIDELKLQIESDLKSVINKGK